MKSKAGQSRDKVILLTGGAGPLDAALATRLARPGTRVYLAVPAGPDHPDIGNERISIHDLDLSQRAEFEQLVSRIKERHQRIDLLINATAFSVLGLVKDLSLEDWDEVFNNNILGIINSIDLVYPGMVERGEGHIVNFGSIAAEAQEPGSIPFATSKAFLLGLDRSLRAEARLTGIDLTLVLPGYLPPSTFQRSRTIKVDREEAESAHTLHETTTEQFADAIVAGITRKKRYLFYPGFRARFHWFLAHWWSSLLNPLQDRFLKPFRTRPSLTSRTHHPRPQGD